LKKLASETKKKRLNKKGDVLSTLPDKDKKKLEEGTKEALDWLRKNPDATTKEVIDKSVELKKL